MTLNQECEWILTIDTAVSLNRECEWILTRDTAAALNRGYERKLIASAALLSRYEQRIAETMAPLSSIWRPHVGSESVQEKMIINTLYQQNIASSQWSYNNMHSDKQHLSLAVPRPLGWLRGRGLLHVRARFQNPMW